MAVKMDTPANFPFFKIPAPSMERLVVDGCMESQKPYRAIHPRSSIKLDEIALVRWNQQALGRREITVLVYGGEARTFAGQVSVTNGLAVGGRRGMSVIAWHPDNATRLVTASEEIIGELSSMLNWAFQVGWCPRNPDHLATVFVDCTVGIHSIQLTSEPTASATPATAGNHADIFDSTDCSQTQGGTLSLKQPPFS
ncbi:hypothetical protein ARMGADRAFT_1092667 [Armillaria gallica]|uniref:Uncharacterized protein n=1 Tax=Armillaria gallica TaxID=47427 RepID=A0A2H3C9Y5_ARMGA|nr:hypothetical protein ARMGADRAFT_1092667 [Armillaria gallica]